MTTVTFKKIISQIICIILLSSVQVAPQECNCRKGFQRLPKLVGRGAWCIGEELPVVIPCRQPKPRCECSPKAIAIVTDKRGTWCLNVNGTETVKTKCFNKEDWEKYDKNDNNSLLRSLFTISRDVSNYLCDQ